MVEMSVLKKHQPTATFLILGISILFSVASLYSNYNCLLEADFLTREAKFEAGDIDNLLAEKQINLDFILSESYLFGSVEKAILRLHMMSSWGLLSPGLSFSPLRC